MPIPFDQALHNLEEAAKEYQEAKINADSLRAKAKEVEKKFWKLEPNDPSAAALRIDLMRAEKEDDDARDVLRRASDKLNKALGDFYAALNSLIFQ